MTILDAITSMIKSWPHWVDFNVFIINQITLNFNNIYHLALYGGCEDGYCFSVITFASCPKEFSS